MAQSRDRGSMSGQMMAFLAVMAFMAYILFTPLLSPEAFEMTWHKPLYLICKLFMWAWGPNLVLLLTVIGSILSLTAAYMVLEKIYRLLFKRSSEESATNPYRIK